MSLFILYTTDYTDNIVVGSYEVNRYNECDKYVTADEVTHYVHLRYRIKGKFDMAFASQADYESFVALYQSMADVNTTVSVTVAVNNYNGTMQNFQAMMTFYPKRTLTAERTDIVREITVQIEEV